VPVVFRDRADAVNGCTDLVIGVCHDLIRLIGEDTAILQSIEIKKITGASGKALVIFIITYE